MAESSNGKTKVALVTAAFSLVTVFFTSYNVYQDNQRKEITRERNQQEAALCDDLNRLNDSLALIIRIATVPEAGDEERDAVESEKFREVALAELERARCVFEPIEPR